MKRLGLCLCLCLCLGAGVGLGGELHTLVSAEGRFLLVGPQAEVLQGLAVWAQRSVRVLEQQAGISIPFQDQVPLRIVLTEAEEETRLFEQFAGGVLRQEIRAPAEIFRAPSPLADAFTRACLNRVLLRAAPTQQPRPQAADWLVAGLSHHLLEEATPQLLELGVQRWQAGTFSRPYAVTGGRVEALTVTGRAEAVWVVRRLLRLQAEREWIWQTLAAQPAPGWAEWAAWLEGVESLRDLHVDWSLWMHARVQTAAAELRSRGMAAAELERLLVFRPAEFGLAGEGVPRHQRMQLPDLLDYDREAWVAPLLQGWMNRFLRLGFRQDADLRQRIELYVEAAGALRLAQERRGRSREEALARFEAAWEAAEAMRDQTSP